MSGNHSGQGIVQQGLSDNGSVVSGTHDDNDDNHDELGSVGGRAPYGGGGSCVTPCDEEGAVGSTSLKCL